MRPVRFPARDARDLGAEREVRLPRRRDLRQKRRELRIVARRRGAERCGPARVAARERQLEDGRSGFVFALGERAHRGDVELAIERAAAQEDAQRLRERGAELRAQRREGAQCTGELRFVRGPALERRVDLFFEPRARDFAEQIGASQLPERRLGFTRTRARLRRLRLRDRRGPRLARRNDGPCCLTQPTLPVRHAHDERSREHNKIDRPRERTMRIESKIVSMMQMHHKALDVRRRIHRDGERSDRDRVC